MVEMVLIMQITRPVVVAVQAALAPMQQVPVAEMVVLDVNL